jgi:hypothetical protein
MPGKNFQLTPLESRKQLLLVESELNRAQLLNELREFKSEIQQVKDQVQAIGALASSAAKLSATVASITSVFTPGEAGGNGQSSWIAKLLNGLRTGASIWGAIRSHRK